MLHKLLVALVVGSMSVAATECGSEAQVLFQSNAYADAIKEDSNYQGGSIISTQSDWNNFLETFHPNHVGESLVRTSINFNEEKVVIGTYATSASCGVLIDKARLECTTISNDSRAVSMNMIIIDTSIGCHIKCLALAQVVYAVAVPIDWEMEESDGFVIDVTGPCLVEAISTTEPPFIKLSEVQVRAECPDGQCLDPDGRCAGEVQCFVDPCDVQTIPCSDGTVCQANYCGGCHDVCVPLESSSTPSTAVDLISAIKLDTTSSTVSAIVDGTMTTTIMPIEMDTTTPSTILTTKSSNQYKQEVRVAFNDGAYSRYLVPDGKNGNYTTIITSNTDLSDFLATFSSLSSQDTTGFDSIDFATEQLVLWTYYQSSTCNVEIEMSSYLCSEIADGGTVDISTLVRDDSFGCEISCDAEGQVVYALVTPLGTSVSVDTSVTGGCVESVETDAVGGTVTLSTFAASTSTTSPSFRGTASGSSSTSPTTKPSALEATEYVPERNNDPFVSSSSSYSRHPLFHAAFAFIIIGFSML
jgi:hypothetical protein